MSYTIYIERHAEEPINPAEWRDAVTASTAFRLQSRGTLTITNPQTGEQISRPLHQNDAEYLDVASQTWSVTLFWSDEGRVRTDGPRDFDNPSNAYRIALVALAASLKASVVGEEGEVYS